MFKFHKKSKYILHQNLQKSCLIHTKKGEPTRLKCMHITLVMMIWFALEYGHRTI